MCKFELSKFSLLRDRDVSLDEFPSLLAMEGHTGSFGALFTAIWAIYAATTIGIAGVLQRLAIAGVFLVALFFLFFFLGWFSFWLSQNYSRKIRGIGNNTNILERISTMVRLWILVLSMIYVVLCAVLIWLTGGAVSPFMPFYVMIFTLTIPKIKNRKRGLLALYYFLLMIFVACLAAWKGISLIPAEDIQLIQNSDYQYWMYLLFMGASLGIPTYSAYRTQEVARSQRQSQAEA